MLLDGAREITPRVLGGRSFVTTTSDQADSEQDADGSSERSRVGLAGHIETPWRMDGSRNHKGLRARRRAFQKYGFPPQGANARDFTTGPRKDRIDTKQAL